MSEFKLNDSVVVAHYSFYRNGKIEIKYNTIEQICGLYSSSIQAFIIGGAEAIYKNYLFKIKNITSDYITLDSGAIIDKNNFKHIYSLDQVKSYIDLHFAKTALTYSKIFNKSLEIQKLANDITNIANAAGINDICNSNLSGAVYPIEQSISHFGWNTSSLSC